MTTGKTPDQCPSCGATLSEVPFDGTDCPHCGYDLAAQPPGFGHEDWNRYPRHHRDNDPEVQLTRTPRAND